MKTVSGRLDQKMKSGEISREDIMKHFGMIKEENSHYHTSIGEQPCLGR